MGYSSNMVLNLAKLISTLFHLGNLFPQNILFHSGLFRSHLYRVKLLKRPLELQFYSYYFFFFNLFIYLFMAVLGHRFCARAFSSCGEWGPLFIAVRGPLTIAASLVAEHRLQMRRLSNCGSRAQLLRSMWDLPRPGLEPVSPALAGRFSTTVPPGKPYPYFKLFCNHAFFPLTFTSNYVLYSH